MQTERRHFGYVLCAIIGATVACGDDVQTEERTDFHRAANGAVYQNDELIVRPTGETSFAQLQQFCANQNPEWVISDGGTNAPLESESGWIRIQFPSPMDANQAATLLNNSGSVDVDIRRNYILEANRIPNDTHWTTGSAWALRQIDAPSAWDITVGDGSVIVAILDTGIDLRHPDLAANIWTNDGELPDNGIDDDGNGFIDDITGYDFVGQDAEPMDDSYDGHGTAVASIVGAIGNNGRGIPGVAWDVKLMPVRVLDRNGQGTLYNIANGIRYAASNGADIILASFSGRYLESAGLDAEPIRAFVEDGGIFVASAGNRGSDNDVNPHFPASYGYDGVISVTSSNRADELADNSNFGRISVDLAAPGVGVDALIAGETGYETLGSLTGSSASAALTAGSVALLKTKHPTLSGAAIEEHLMATGDSMATTGPLGEIRCNEDPTNCRGKRLNIGNALGGDQALIEAPVIVEPDGFVATTNAREVQLTWAYSDPSAANLLGFDIQLYSVSEEENANLVLVDTNIDAAARVLTLDARQAGGRVAARIRARSATGALSTWTESASLELVDTTSPGSVVDLTATASAALDLGYTIRSSSGEMGDSWVVENLLNRTAGNSWASAPKAEAHTAWVVLDLGENPAPYWEVAIAPSTLYPNAFASAVQVSSSPNAVAWSALASSHGLNGNSPVELRFSATQDRYLKVDFALETRQPGDRYYTVVDYITVAGAPNSDRALELFFTAPGDDPGFGRAASYTVYYSAEEFDADNYRDAPGLLGGNVFVWSEPQPKVAGSLELRVVDQLAVETEYWFALTATDAAGNTSLVSNVAHAQTAYISPPAVRDLLAVRSEDLETSVITFTAPADGSNEVPRAYSLRYSTQPLDLLSFDNATPVEVDVAEPGTTVEVTVPHGRQEGVLFFALRTQDDTLRWSPLSNIARSYPSSVGDNVSPATVTNLTAFISEPTFRHDDFDITAPGEDGEVLLDGFAMDVRDGDTDTAATWSTETLTFTYNTNILADRLILRAPTDRLSTRRLPPKVAVSLSVDGEYFEEWTNIVTEEGQSLLGPSYYDINLGGHWIRALRLSAVETRDAPPTNATFAVSEIEFYARHANHNALVTFTAPGDDGYDGFADAYMLRGSTNEPFDFDSAVEFETGSPNIGGSLELIPVSQLAPEETYHFAVRAEDDANNVSEISNISTVVTPAIPPSAPRDLRVHARYPDRVELSWLPSGDDGLDGDPSDYRCQIVKELPLVGDATCDNCIADIDTCLGALSGCDNNQQATIQISPSADGNGRDIIEVLGLQSNQWALIQCVGIDEDGRESLPTAPLLFSTLDGLRPQPLTDFNLEFDNEQIAVPLEALASNPNQWEWNSAPGHFAHSIHISDPNQALTNYTLRLETSSGALLWSQAPEDTDTHGVFMLGDLPIETDSTLILRAHDLQGAALEDVLNRDITATLLRRRTVEEWLDFDIRVQGSWDDRVDEPTTAATLEFALVDQGSPCRGFERTSTTTLTLGSFEPIEATLNIKDLGLVTSAEEALGKQLCYRALATDEDGNTQPIDGILAPLTGFSKVVTNYPLSAPQAPIVSEVSVRSATLTLTTHAHPILEDECPAGLEVSYEFARRTPEEWHGWTIPVEAGPDCNTSTAFLTEALDGALYAVAVRALDANGTTSPPSISTWFETERNLPPAVIERPTLTVNEDGHVVLSFIEPEETNTDDRVIRYQYLYGPISAETLLPGELAASDWNPGATKSITLTETPEQETRYMAAIRAVDSFGKSALYSDYGYLDRCTPGGEPPAQITLEADNIKMLPGSSSTVTFTAPGDDGEGPGQALLYRATLHKLADGAPTEEIELGTLPRPGVPGSTDTIELGWLEEDSEFRFTLHATDDCNNAGETTSIDFTMLDFTQPDAVDTLGMTARSTTDIELSWRPSCDNALLPGESTCRGVSSYRIECVNRDSVLVDSFEIEDDGFIRHTLGGLPHETPQTCSVTALDNCQNMSPCQVAGTQSTAWTEVVPPAAANVNAERTKELPEEITLAFAMPGDDGFEGTARRIIARSGVWPLNVATCDTSLLDTELLLFQDTIPSGNEEVSVTLSGFDSLTRYCFQVVVEDDAHEPSVGRLSESESALVGVSYIDNRDPPVISNEGFEVVAGSSTQTLKVTFKPPIDLPLNLTIDTYAVVVSDRPFESADCETTPSNSGAPQAATAPFECIVRDEGTQELAAEAFRVSKLISGPPTDGFVTVVLDDSHGVRDEAKNYVALIPVDAMDNIPNLSPTTSPHQPASAWTLHNPPTTPLTWVTEQTTDGFEVSFRAPFNDRVESVDEVVARVDRYEFQCGLGTCESMEPCAAITPSTDSPGAPGSEESFLIVTSSAEEPTCVAVDIYDWEQDQEVPENWEPARLRFVTNAAPPGVTQLKFNGVTRDLSWGGVVDQPIDLEAAVEHYAVIIDTEEFENATCELATLPPDVPVAGEDDWDMNCALTGDDGIRTVAVDALDLGDAAPYQFDLLELNPDGISYWMTVLAVDDHGIAGGMPTGTNKVIEYTTPQIKPNVPTLTASREYTLSGYNVRYTFTAPADDANPDDPASQAVERYIPLCYAAERGGACPDPHESPYATCESIGILPVFDAPAPRAPGLDEAFQFNGLPAGNQLCMQLAVLDDYAANAHDSGTPNSRESWTLSSVTSVSLFDAPSSVDNLSLSTGTEPGSLSVGFTAPDDGAGGVVTRYEYLIGSSIPDLLPNCDERTAYTWNGPEEPGNVEVRALTNLDAETGYSIAVRSIRDVNGIAFCSDWTIAGPSFTGCAAPQTIADLNCLPMDDDGRVDLVCSFTSPSDVPQGVPALFLAKVLDTTSGGVLNANNFEDVGDTVAGLPLPGSAGTSLTFTLSDMAESSEFTVGIRSQDAAGCISGVATDTVITPDLTPPAAITEWTITSPTTDTGPVPIVAVTPSSILNDAWNGNHVIDGDPSTSWASELSYERREEFMVLNLGAPQTIDRITLKPDPLYPDFFPKAFRVEGTDELTFGGSGDILVRETDLLIEDAGQLEWAFAPMDARLVKITTSEPQKSFGIYYSILAEAQALRARPAAANLNINVRLTGDDGETGRATCLATFYADQPFSFNDLPASAHNCETVPLLFQRDATTRIRSVVSSDLGLPGSLKTVGLEALPGETVLWIVMVVIDEAGNVSPPRELQEQTTAILPAAVSDLSGTALDTDQIKLTFTAPADDPGADWPPEHERGVQNFDVRYSPGALTSRNFGEAAGLTFDAGLPGQRQEVTIDGLEPSTEYRFAMVTRDDDGAMSSLSNVVVIRTKDAADDEDPGEVTDLTASAPDIIPQPIGNLVAMDDGGTTSDEAQVLVDGDVTTVWQPVLGEDTEELTVYLDIPGENESAVVGSMEIATLGGFESWLPGKVDARCTLGGPTYETLDNNAVVSQSDANQTIEFETHRSCKRVRLTFSEFGDYGGEPILAIGNITLITGVPTTPSAVLRWTASGDDGFDGIASRLEVRGGACDAEEGILNPTLIGSYDNPVEAGLLERRQFEVPESLRDIDPLCVKVTTLDETGRRSDSNVATVAP